MVRDMYTKSWSAFDRLISVIPPGGSIGLDDKLFSFWILHNEAPATWNMRKGVYRVAKIKSRRSICLSTQQTCGGGKVVVWVNQRETAPSIRVTRCAG